MNIGVGPEFIPLEAAFVGDSLRDWPAIRSGAENREPQALVGIRVAYLREGMIGRSNCFEAAAVAAMGADSETGHLPGLAVDAD